MRFRVLLLTAFLVLPLYAAERPFGQLQEEQKFKDYTVRVYRVDNRSKSNDGLGCFEILRSDKQVYFREGQFFEVGKINFDMADNAAPIKMGQNITGDKKPELLVSEWNSGNNSDCSFYVFQVGDTFKRIAKIDASQIGETSFQDLRHDGNLEIVTGDTTFCYWNVSGADSQKERVILRYQNGKYSPDLELMRKPAQTDTELQLAANTFRTHFHKPEVGDDWGAPFKMWQQMADLIYSGHMDLAWRLLDLSWPANLQNRAAFLRAFMRQLKTSLYFEAIRSPSFQGNLSFPPHLTEPLRFAAFTVSNVSPDQVNGLMSSKVYAGFNSADSEHYDFLQSDTGTNRLRVETVSEFRAAIKAKWFPYTTYDMEVGEWFDSASDTLDFMARARSSNRSFLQKQFLMDLPVSVLMGNLEGDQDKALKEDVAKRKTLKDYARRDALIHLKNFKISGNTMTFVDADNDDTYQIRELARGDVDGDGCEDALVLVYGHTEGTLGWSWTCIATRKGPKDKLTLVKINRVD